MERWLETFARTVFKRSAGTAHDLKTPLNIAVLNLELLRIEIAKMTDAENEKVSAYVAAIDGELRRIAQIFDTFFLLSTPPKDEDTPPLIDVAPLWREAARSSGIDLKVKGRLLVRIHESRIRQALRLFFDGAFRRLNSRDVKAGAAKGEAHIAIRGVPESADFEPARLLKFCYTNPSGNPDLSLATARLIVETYGGELNATREHDKVIFRLSLPRETNETSSDR